ncbi:ribosomal RNA processing protein [Exidia glandulosa HHB12029]|uniref:Ribosomal RNA processing protein n=1 Tax=Exidia glandulosa HHB12029 TaxID=1314781 RepID=A0A165EZJ3_EXIGL|nr:ribosomal RNA processing protein [Exidia glandulosa HHB12029]
MTNMSASPAPSLAKNLAATEKKTRDKAVKAVAAFLADDASVAAYSKADMDKLWKALFYCYWMSDKPLVQQALATELSELLMSINSTEHALRFLRSFWETTVREWGGLDRLRMDKFYMLVRRYVNAGFRMLARAKWDEDSCKEYQAMLRERGCPLCPDDNKVPSSLAYHLADIYLEELEKALNAAPSPSPAPLTAVLEPFISLAALTANNRTYDRVANSVLRPLLNAMRTALKAPPPQESERGERKSKRVRLDDAARSVLTPAYPTLFANARLSCSAEEVQPLKLAALRTGVVGLIFEQASKEETRDSNRRKLYDIWKEEMDEEEFALPPSGSARDAR